MSTQNPQLPVDGVVFADISWRRLWRALIARSPKANNSATFSAATTVAVTLNPPLPDADYSVHAMATEDNYFWITSQTATGFTLNAKNSTSATVFYTIVRR